jgi:transposase
MELIEVNSTLPMNRRRWSRNEKLAILKETAMPGTNLSAVARKHGLTPSLFFNWKKKFERDGSISAVSDVGVGPISEYQHMLMTIRQREALLELAASKIENEAASNKIGAYNLSCSVSNLVNATTKLQAQKLDLIERLNNQAGESTREQEAINHGDPDDLQFAIERESEKICYALVKQKVLNDRAEAAANAKLLSAHSS